MKKTLTENISRYDDKMRLRLDWRTVRAILISLVPAVLLGWLLSYITIMIALPVALIAFFGLALIQLGTVDGYTLSTYIKEVLRQLARRRLFYLYTETNRMTDAEKGREPHGEQKQKKK